MSTKVEFKYSVLFRQAVIDAFKKLHPREEIKSLVMFVVWLGSKYAGLGAAIVGCSLLAGGLFRLVLPARDAGLLSSRRKASDVLSFAAFGAAVLAVAIALP